MSETTKKHYLSGNVNNTYINWMYEASASKNIERIRLLLKNDPDLKEMKNIIADRLARYRLCLSEITTMQYKKKNSIDNIRYYIEENDERCFIEYDNIPNRLNVSGTADLAIPIAADLQKLLPMKEKNSRYKNHISVIVPARMGGLTTRPYPIKSKNFTDLNYTSRVRKAYRETINNFKAKDPSGRLLLLKGPPGTGKTYFIRALIGDVLGNKIFIPSHLAAALSGPDLLEVLINIKSKNNDKQILIFEDAENLLLERKIDNSSLVSTVLNFADGFLAELTNTYIVASTNIDEDINIDSAILRPGRLMEKIDFPRLDADHANRLYKSLAGNDGDFNSPAVLAEVYSRAKGGVVAEDDLKPKAGFMAAG